MTKSVSPRPKPTASVLIGLWIGLTVLAGLGMLSLLWALWAFGGFNAAPAATSSMPPTVPVIVATSTSANGGATVLPTSAAKTACKYPPAPASGFGYGIQSHVFGGGDLNYFLPGVRELGLQWLKIQVRWDNMEPAQGNIDWHILDTAMKVSCEQGLHVMMSVVAAPAWTHAQPPSADGTAPPDDFQTYADFIAKLVDRYPGQVGAIEVWNEENLEREWNTPAGISPDDFLKLLRLSYTTIKSKDPSIIVISGALSPTGINCNVGPFPQNCKPAGRTVVMDDATYLTKLVQAGALQYTDCVGTHSNGTNLPPTADGANPPADNSAYKYKGPWQNPHYSWALKSQVETYAKILNGQKPQCVTEFGYASPLEGKFPPLFGFAQDVTEQQQADYLVQAFNWMRDSKLVKLAFLFNLDYGQLGTGDPSQDANMLFSLLDMHGVPRPAFGAIKAMAKP